MDYITEKYFELLEGCVFILRCSYGEKRQDDLKLATHLEGLLENMKLHLESILRNTDD